MLTPLTKAETMNITLDPELESFVRSKVTSGEFPDLAAVVAAGLRRWREDETLHCRSWDEIRELVRAGIADIEHGHYQDLDQASLERFFSQPVQESAGAGRTP